MPVRRRAGIGRQLDEENREEIVASVEMAEGAVDAETVPRLHLRLQQVQRSAGMDRHALALRPVLVGIDQVFPRRRGLTAVVHRAAWRKGVSSMNLPMPDVTPCLPISSSHIL